MCVEFSPYGTVVCGQENSNVFSDYYNVGTAATTDDTATTDVKTTGQKKIPDYCVGSMNSRPMAQLFVVRNNQMFF